MTKIISTHSFRGGTGKSNTTANLAVMVAKHGFRVGVIDTDIQSPGIHVLFQFDAGQSARSLNDYLWGRCTISDAAYDVTENCLEPSDNGTAGGKADRPRLFLIPASLRVGEIARILREGYDVSRLIDGLQDVVGQLQLDYLFIDTHPGVNEETLLSIAISDVLILIVRPDNQDLQGTAVAVELARKLDIPRMMIVLNKVPSGMNRLKLQQDIEQMFGSEVVAILPLNTEIVQLASSTIFSNRYPDHPFTQELRAVVTQLLPKTPAS